MKIKEVLVVEGRNDSNVLKSHFDCETIITNGTHVSKEIIKLIKDAQETRGVIVFTDPDFPGESIRRTINDAVPGCKQAFVEKEKAMTPKKVGVEHASKETLEDALANMVTYTEDIQSLSLDDFRSFGFEGQPNSGELRYQVAKHYHLGKPNAKTLWKRLNMLAITKEDLEKLMEEIR